jgi:hypothetical protein
VDRVAAIAVLLLAACKAPLPEGPVCGLHSASAPVTAGPDGRTLAVGAKVLGTDKLKAQGWALLECFTGGVHAMDRETVKAGELREARVEMPFPRHVLKGDEVEEVEALARPVEGRYSSNRFTPESAKSDDLGASDNYLVAFFTPNGFAPDSSADGPHKLPAPPMRSRVPFIHAGDLGEGDWTIDVKDDVVFAETDDLATAALVEGKTYRLGRSVRLLLPDGAVAKLHLPGDKTVKIKGPMDLKLR